MDVLTKLRNTVSNTITNTVHNTAYGLSQLSSVLPGNPVTREFEVTAHIASAGPGLLWKIYNGYKKSTKQAAAIFVFEKRILERWSSKTDRELVLETLKRGIMQLTKLRHPQILTVQHPLEESRDSLAFATEPVFASLANALGNMENVPQPLPSNLRNYKLLDIEIRYGLLQLGEGLAFLHGDVKLLHRNLCPESIVINSHGVWKVFGFDFCALNQNIDSKQPSWSYTEYDPTTPSVTYPQLDYQAPECILASSNSPSSDIFSLGMLIYVIHSPDSRPLHESQNDLSRCKRFLENFKGSAVSSKLFSVPENLRDTTKLMLSHSPELRPDPHQFIKIEYFMDIGVKTLNYLDKLFQWDNLQKSQFYKGLPKVLKQIPHRVILHRVLPSLYKELVNPPMIPFVLPSILQVMESCEVEEFREHILPNLKPVLALEDPPQISLVLMQQVNLLLKLCPADVIKSDIVPMLTRALESGWEQLQELCLTALPNIVNMIEGPVMKNAILPRIKKICLNKKNHSSVTLGIRVNCLLCLAKMLPSFDRWLVYDEILPLLQEIPQTREPAILMAVIGIYRLLLTHSKMGISKEILATKVLPFLLPLCVEQNLSSSQFETLSTLVIDMINRVTTEHREALKQLDAVRRETQQFEKELSATTQITFPESNILSDIDVTQQKSSTNVLKQSIVIENGLTMEEKLRLAKQQETHQRLQSQESLTPKAISSTSKAQPKDLTATLMKNNLDKLNLSASKSQNSQPNYIGPNLNTTWNNHNANQLNSQLLTSSMSSQMMNWTAKNAASPINWNSAQTSWNMMTSPNNLKSSWASQAEFTKIAEYGSKVNSEILQPMAPQPPNLQTQAKNNLSNQDIMDLLSTSRSIANINEPILLKVIVPASHVALSGDLTIFILESSQEKFSTVPNEIEETEKDITEENTTESFHSITENPLVLRVLFLNGLKSELIGEFPLDTLPDKGENVTLTIPCGYFSRGGTYTLQLEYKFSTVPSKITDIADLSTIQMSNALDVKWPTPSLFLERQRFTTYPNVPISVTLRYNEIFCEPSENVPAAAYTLQLIYCGSSTVACDPQNKSRVQVLYHEEIKGFPKQKHIILHCEYFGLAGDYAIRLKASPDNPNAPTTSAYIKVDWSEEFVFSVHARSIYPCEGSRGISVIFEYPSCRLQGDRVRVYGRLRANVQSLAPPSTLHYIAELKAVPGKHTLTFECDIFKEKFIEYCFVYVSQAITGAMAEVKLSCIPTFPFKENDAGGWGSWSPWTPCSSSCIGGIRNRYRFCDNPPPRYDTKFCQGKAIETESCGGSLWLGLRDAWNMADWDCHHGAELAAIRPEVTAQIGVKCRCGCLIALSEETSRKILAANTQACPGRSFWLVEARPNFVVRLHVDQARFPCPGQYFRVRDGDSLSANLLTDIAFDKSLPPTRTVISTGEHLLLEFFSDEITTAGESCVGGFLAHAVIIYKPREGNETLMSVPFKHNSTSVVGEWIFWMTPAHLVAASLLMLIFFVSISLALQFAFKYRKYHIAEDLDTLSEYSVCSDSGPCTVRREKTLSSATLISEVVSLVRLSRRGTPNHTKLESTSCGAEEDYDSSETQAEYEDETTAKSGTLKLNDSEASGSQNTIVSSKDITESVSFMSNIVFVGQPEVKYARPVKLRKLGSQSPTFDQDSTTIDESKIQITSDDSTKNAKLRHYDPSNVLQGKEFSPVRMYSNVPTLRTGKETKDRRNRERLLHGPGSEYSLINHDMDLELDYYDYNVANAGAVPGSYLGMDPAFLVWIPPLLSSDSDIIPMENIDGRLMEGQLGKEGLVLDTEGATLTPSEYRKMKLLRAGESKSNLGHSPNAEQLKEDSLKKCDSKGNILSDEDSYDGKEMLIERLLPIHRILEDSRIRVSEESLSGQAIRERMILQNIIPNRLYDNATSISKSESDISTEKTADQSSGEHKQANLPNSSKDNNRVGITNVNNVDNSIPQVEDKDKNIKSPLSVKRNRPDASYSKLLSYVGYKPKVSTVQDDKKKNDELIDGNIQKNEQNTDKTKDKEKSKSLLSNLDLTNVMQYKYKDFTHFTKPCENKNNLDIVNIPMMELSRGCLKSPVKVHKQVDKKRIVVPQEEILSPDYGVETDMKDESHESFYDLIRESENEIKYADEDDEYIDNKAST
ncbi:hypothetical protein M0802_011033 [Mischocyttarus mexicanus]|nr:hypothetical protein M0802_011033 [Mischocyttarus mexicanus]